MSQSWITFNGNTCPVDIETYVTTFHRDGSKATTRLAENCNWEQFGDGDDIIAYCVSDEPTPVRQKGTIETNGRIYSSYYIQGLDKEELKEARVDLELVVNQLEVKQADAYDNRNRSFRIKNVKSVAKTLLNEVNRRINDLEREENLRIMQQNQLVKEKRREDSFKNFENQQQLRLIRLEEDKIKSDNRKTDLELKCKKQAISTVRNFLENVAFCTAFRNESKKFVDKETYLAIVESSKSVVQSEPTQSDEEALNTFFNILGVSINTQGT